MIVQEALGEFVHTYSDDGHWLIQNGTGIQYDEAIDPPDKGRTYHEGDINPHWIDPKKA